MLIEQSLLLGQRSVFLGFRNGIKGFVLLDMSTNQIFVSRNVVFYDHILPYKVPSVAIDSQKLLLTHPHHLKHLINLPILLHSLSFLWNLILMPWIQHPCTLLSLNTQQILLLMMEPESHLE